MLPSVDGRGRSTPEWTTRVEGAGRRGLTKTSRHLLLLLTSWLPCCQMLSIVDGKERSLPEWTKLLDATGWRLRRVHPLRAMPSLLEAVPVPR